MSASGGAAQQQQWRRRNRINNNPQHCVCRVIIHDAVSAIIANVLTQMQRAKNRVTPIWCGTNGVLKRTEMDLHLYDEEQACFRTVRFCVDHFNIVRIISEKSVEFRSHLNMRRSIHAGKVGVVFPIKSGLIPLHNTRCKDIQLDRFEHGHVELRISS